ncbi:MAG: CpXC domain-containing protein, partial [Treponema sp.]|nr:CpXC domain-containing protein [Treponema sp.]
MKQKIPCFCDNNFEVEVPEEINLDSDPKYLEEILDGTFMNFICPSCGKKHKPEFKLSILWPSKELHFE